LAGKRRDSQPQTFIRMDTEKKALIVDDSPVVCKLYKSLFEKKGYGVITVGDGESALKQLSVERFSVMLLDLVMPGMSGIDVLKSCRKDNQEVCIIVATGCGSEETAVEAIREGADDYIVKDYVTGEFDIIIARGLEKRRLVLENIRLHNQLKGFNVTLQNAYTQIKDEKDHCSNLLSNVAYGVVLSKNDGCILGFNDHFLRITGLQERTVFGASLFDFIEPERRSEVESLFKSVRRGMVHSVKTHFAVNAHKINIVLNSSYFMVNKERCVLSAVMTA